MMRTRVLLAGVVWLSAVEARAVDVAVLRSTDDAASRAVVEAFRKSAGAPRVFTDHDLKGDRAEAIRVLDGLRGRPMVVLAVGPLAARTVREVAPEVPVVFCMVPEPEKLGLVPAPGVAGVAYRIPVRNQLAAFRSVNPRGVRIGVMHGPETAEVAAEAHRTAPTVRLDVAVKPLGTDGDVRPALRALFTGPEAVDALWVPADSLLAEEETRRLVLKEAARAGKPVYGFAGGLVEEGALVSNGPSLASIGEQAADLVARLLAGERGTIGIVYPQAELVINMKAAARLKIDIPPGALAAARKTY
jgi:ABC-type uncharacterized transport system substrate-binding protein